MANELGGASQQRTTVMASSCKYRNALRGTRRRTELFMIAVSLLLLTSALISLSRRILLEKRDVEVQPVFLDHPLPAQNSVPTNTADLIAKLAATTRRAASSGHNNTSEISEWHNRHSCISRHEIYEIYNTRKLTHDTGRNLKWDRVLEAYTELHRTCVRRMGDVDEFFLQRKEIDGCKFVVAGVSTGSGIGNKALSIVSALVYAVLTQRVLLVPEVTAVPGVFCEPFEGSSWTVDPNKKWAESKKRKDLWLPLSSFYTAVDSRPSPSTPIAPIHAVSATEIWDAQPEPRFFCDTEQSQYTQVAWINFRNNLYFVPKLFAVPSFRPVLEDIFPTHNPFTPLLRTVMLPRDPVWARVKQVHDAHFRHAARRVGVQERYFNGKPDFLLLHKATEDNILSCLITHAILPNPNASPSPDPKLSPAHPRNVTTVFITSLYQSLFDRFTEEFVRVALPSSDAIGLVQLTHENAQDFGVEVDRQALTEILCLSLTDHLILTPQSTFGALAQGYGGVVPWFVDLRPETATPCVRAQTSEACYQIPASKRFTCPHDVGVNGKAMTEVVEYLGDCHAVEEPFVKVNGAGLGLQLVSMSDMRFGEGEEDADEKGEGEEY